MLAQSATRLTLKKQSHADTRPIAFCGTRGIPANYGGFETAVDEITKGFAADGIPTAVFCRSSNSDQKSDCHQGRTRLFISGSKHRSLDTFVSSIQTGWHLLRHRNGFRFVFWFNNANLPGIILTRLAGIPMAVNTDGLEWRRAKWSWPFKLYYWLSSWLVTRICGTLISDSHGIRDYYKSRFGVSTEFVPYGTPTPLYVESEKAGKIFAKYGVEPGKYFLQITRIEPDNLPLETATAFASSNLDSKGFKFILIGYKDPTTYAAQLKQLDGISGVSVCPAEYDPDTLAVLRAYCHAYVHGNSVGGTNPALLEAMASCPRIIAIDSPFSKEVLGECGTLFDPHNIAPSFEECLSMGNQHDRMKYEVESRYTWKRVTKSYRRIAAGLPADYESAETSVVAIHDRALTVTESK